MEKDRKIKTVAVAAVLVAIIGLSIAFAALSQTLTINGNAKADKSTWQVVWEKIASEEFVTTGTAEVQENYPTLSNNDTNLNLGTITLKKPGDKVTYKINMANKGDIDAKVTGVTGVSVDNTYVSYSVKYLDNNTDITAANGRLLAAGEKKLVLIEIKFKESVTTEQFKAIPSEGITVDFNQVSISYTQDDGTGTLDPEPASYSFTLNDLGSPTINQGILFYDLSSLSFIEDLLEEPSYYVDVYDGMAKSFYLNSSDSNFINVSTVNTINTSSFRDEPHNENEMYKFCVIVYENNIMFTIAYWDGSEWREIADSDVNDILTNYGDVTLTFTQIPSSFIE